MKKTKMLDYQVLSCCGNEREQLTSLLVELHECYRVSRANSLGFNVTRCASFEVSGSVDQHIRSQNESASSLQRRQSMMEVRIATAHLDA